MNKTNRKGFTIVELVIVIAVIAILAAVLIPTFSNVIDSAKETANLSEAESTLKAYVGYMGSKGQSLGDGPVFEVEDTTYVYYKGSLHKFQNAKEVRATGNLQEAPVIEVGSNSYACNKYFNTFVEDGEVVNPTISGNTYEYVTFFYADYKEIQFDNGSEKCSIYPGTVVYSTEDLTDENLTIKDKSSWYNYNIGHIVEVNKIENVECDKYISVNKENKAYNDLDVESSSLSIVYCSVGVEGATEEISVTISEGKGSLKIKGKVIGTSLSLSNTSSTPSVTPDPSTEGE